MYILKSGIKRDKKKRWELPDRIFFGYGACHILAGTYLVQNPIKDFYAERIIPKKEQPGNHIYVTDGQIAFDYHGYSVRGHLLEYHHKNCSKQYDPWDYELEKVAFDLLNTVELNQRKMLGPDQYLFDPVVRAVNYLNKINHAQAYAKAIKRCSPDPNS
ncbi:MAG: hypothetical protein HWE34_03405 [Methylocystaceae bacterium]|nr:hypothetical protein [Methylocystaceae bacterium]